MAERVAGAVLVAVSVNEGGGLLWEAWPDALGVKFAVMATLTASMPALGFLWFGWGYVRDRCSRIGSGVGAGVLNHRSDRCVDGRCLLGRCLAGWRERG